MPSLSPLSLVRNGNVEAPPVTREEAARLVRETCDAAIAYATEAGDDCSVQFCTFEREARERAFAIGRALVVLFLVVAEARIAAAIPPSLKIGARKFRRAPAQTRNLNTMLGIVRYTRTYLRQVVSVPTKTIRGFHPTDAELGLTDDRMTMGVLALSARMATKMSFAEAHGTTALAIPTAPSTEAIEKAVLGLGKHTENFLWIKPPPFDDGDVLVIMVDAKGVPMAGEEELDRRRGNRAPEEERAPSPRHRGRKKRRRHGKKPRRKTGDGSKNARNVNMVVMYTLKRNGELLLGPINRRIYASFASKEHAFRYARSEADKRGFFEGSGKLIHLVTDGDNDLARYISKYFPGAIQTIDFAHVVEKLWTVGVSIFEEGTPEHRRWFAEQRARLRKGKIQQILRELRKHQAATPRTGPGAKTRHRRFDATISYLDKRVARMNYAELIARDMEISTGQIEGAIKNVVGKRCDHGGMRWIKERAEAVVQLRCIELNGDWDEFTAHVHDAQRKIALATGIIPRLQSDSPRPLPEIRNTELRRARRRQTALERDQRLAIAA